MIVPRKFLRAAALLLLPLMLVPERPAYAYSLLTHEQLIDLTWKRSIVPLLLSRYPSLTPAQLEHARAFAYGGCVIQDIGYYPFGDAFFSDLTHYVRSGDFVVNLFRNAGNADELAFAVGALSHYIGDTVGHATATNLAVPVEFPKLRARYGNSVSYAEGQHQHVQTEFAFDINEIAQHHLAPVHYLRHVGLEVPTRQVALAFYQTYGLSEDFTAGRGRRINVRGYRFAVRNFIPRIAYAVTLLHRSHEPAEIPSADLTRLEAEIAIVAAENQWDQFRRKPGLGTWSLAGLLYVLPKVGPIRLAAVKGPTAATDQSYIHSVIQSSDSLHTALARFTPPPTPHPSAALAAATGTSSQPAPGIPLPLEPASSQGGPNDSPAQHAITDPRHPLPNRDLDTGNPVQPAGYPLSDTTYAALLHRLVATPTQPIPPGVKSDILAYFADLNAPFAMKKNPQAWTTLQHDLTTLATVPTSTEPLPFPTYGEDPAAAPAPAQTSTNGAQNRP